MFLYTSLVVVLLQVGLTSTSIAARSLANAAKNVRYVCSHLPECAGTGEKCSTGCTAPNIKKFVNSVAEQVRELKNVKIQDEEFLDEALRLMLNSFKSWKSCLVRIRVKQLLKDPRVKLLCEQHMNSTEYSKFGMKSLEFRKKLESTVNSNSIFNKCNNTGWNLPEKIKLAGFCSQPNKASVKLVAKQGSRNKSNSWTVSTPEEEHEVRCRGVFATLP
ncbi:hypothetical protein RUM44_000317 [Polyplax serrata]|uniref:Uncharacterized protein n=1 Tax=Polyplax serrata TaxID=468196 RepID=A0ABR1B539_POLSC